MNILNIPSQKAENTNWIHRSILALRSIFVLFVIALLQACDSGDIYPKNDDKEVFDVKVEADFSLKNIEAFPENYNILLGTFIGTSPYPTSFKLVDKPDNKDMSVSLSSIPKGTTSIKLCLADNVENKTIYSFFEYPLTETPQEDIFISGEEINLATFGRIQAQVFSQCLFCHGSGSSVSGELNLTDSKSYQQLANMPSVINTSKMRVASGSVLNSFLIDILTDESAAKYNHTKISTLKMPDDITVLEKWIEDGAKEE